MGTGTKIDPENIIIPKLDGEDWGQEEEEEEEEEGWGEEEEWHEVS